MSCPAPTANPADTLPFAVDSRFIPSGYEGEYGQITNDGKAGVCGGRATPEAGAPLGNCYAVTYKPILPGGVGYKGGAGVAWQYPANNWGAGPGYLVPPGAKNVSFYAKGKLGGEVVSFEVGQITPSVTAPCGDTIITKLGVTLTSSWAQYSIPITGPYAMGQIVGFLWYVSSAANVPVVDGGADAAGPVEAAAGDAASDAAAADSTVPATDAGDAAPVVDAGPPTGPAIQFFIDDIRWQ